MEAEYQVISPLDRRKLTEFLLKEGQFLLPMVKLIEQGEAALDEMIDVMGRASIEAVLELSAMEVAGAKHKGREGGAIRWHGRQNGVVPLAERKVKVDRPRLRRKGTGTGAEVAVPVYDVLQTDSRLGRRMLEILMLGVSTRRYEQVLPAMAESASISKSTVSREAIEASEKLLKELAERSFADKDILIVYIDGIRFGEHHVLGAIGVDCEGNKHVLGLRAGASENTTTVTELLGDLVERGVRPGRRRLFVIDGAKALRNAIAQVYGSDNPVQRCRQHKLRNVLAHLPKEKHDQARSTIRAAWKLEAEEGIKRLEQLARWYQKDHPSAASSIREGLEEMFTINRLELPGTLRRCLGTTNLIDSSHSGMRQRTRRVTNWQNGSMALRWAASALEATARNFRKIMGHQQLWILKAYLDEPTQQQEKIAEERRVG
jgi:transposase-like protein